MVFFDSHCHIPDPKYTESVDNIYTDCVEAGVTHLITIGTSLKESESVINTAETYENVYAAVGVYPHEDIGVNFSVLIPSLEKMLNKSNKVVAIGECGIDVGDWDGSRPLDQQKELFEAQITLASKYDLPIIIHNRNGDDVVLDIIKSMRMPVRGVLHCFSSDVLFAKKMLDLDFHISFSGMITYPSRKSLLEVVKFVPSDRYLIETDSPLLPPQGHRGEVNYPKYVRIVAEKVAEARGESLEKVAKDTFSNTMKVIGKYA